MSDSELPQTLGRYRLDAVLGRGAMGVVYKAHDPAIDRTVAVKVVRTDLLSGEDKANFLAFFRREAQAAGRCAHKNIVTIYDFSDEAERPFIAMEFVEGETLHAVLRRRGKLEMGEALAIALQVLDALAYAHRLDIVHRDIKPANLILRSGAEVKITDFGVARLGRSPGITEAGVVGTPSYMSPEQISGGTIDARTDLFATGAMLYEMLAGEKAFPGRDASEVMAMIVRQESLEPGAAWRGWPPALQAVLRRALAKRAEDRFQSADGFAGALKAVLEGEGSSPTIVAESDGTVVLRGPGAGDTSRADAWDRGMLHEIERDLAHHVGPMARVLVNQAAALSQNVADLSQRLAAHIPDEAGRAIFLKKRRERRDPSASQASAIASRTTGRTTTSPSLAPAPKPDAVQPEHVAAAQEALALYLGPIARVLVKQALADAASLPDFLGRLAAKIDRDADRTAFRQKLSRYW